MTTRYVCWKTGTNSARRRALHKNVGIKPFPAYISSIRHFETRGFLTKNRLIRHNWSGNSSGKAPPPQPGGCVMVRKFGKIVVKPSKANPKWIEASNLTPVSAFSEWPDLPNRQTATFPCTQDGRDEAAAWLTRARRRIEADVWEPERIAKRKAKDHCPHLRRVRREMAGDAGGRGTARQHHLRHPMHRQDGSSAVVRRHADRQDHLRRHRALRRHAPEGPPIRRPGAAVQAPPDPRLPPRPRTRLRRSPSSPNHHSSCRCASPRPGRRHPPPHHSSSGGSTTPCHANSGPAITLAISCGRPAHRRGLRPPTRRHSDLDQPSHPHPPHQTHPRPRHRRAAEDRQKQTHRCCSGVSEVDL